MKNLTRSFSGKEKVILVLMLAIVLGFAYKFLVHDPVVKSIEEEHKAQGELRDQIDAANTKISFLTQMEEELAALKASGESASYMPQYNADKRERAFLGSILRNTKDWSINIGDCTRSGDQIRRQFTVTFLTDTYENMEWFVMQITKCSYRCVINNINCSITRSETPEGEEKMSVLVTLTATFFETMVGGEPDAALPSDTGR
ncbi:MAG: hypothetical protein IIY94_08540 [Oscillospiraceae bacterium]|nr:hypothetical protein [Oscillospiraceae bacterium]